jgi:S1-C subfamily serine protease
VTVKPLTEANGKKYGWKGDEGGLIITKVEDRSDADSFGLRAGDLVLKVQGNPVNSVEQLRKMTSDKALNEGVRLFVRGYRSGAGRNLFMQNR